MSDDDPTTSNSSKRRVVSIDPPPPPQKKKKVAVAVAVNDSSPDPPSSNNRDNEEKLEDHLICPITHELPIDPVMADDGFVYERSAITKWIEARRGTKLTSPKTLLPMGSELRTAVQTKNTIELLVRTGGITGPLADRWKRINDMIMKAESGDVRAMMKVFYNYSDGEDGFPKDDGKAYFWITKAHDKGDSFATSQRAKMLLGGWGVEKDERQGIMYLTQAAERGIDCAAYTLGLALADGNYGLPVDPKEAVVWLKRAVSGRAQLTYLSVSQENEARELLATLLKEN